jgi:hypothetical protein
MITEQFNLLILSCYTNTHVSFCMSSAFTSSEARVAILQQRLSQILAINRYFDFRSLVVTLHSHHCNLKHTQGSKNTTKIRNVAFQITKYESPQELHTKHLTHIDIKCQVLKTTLKIRSIESNTPL